MSTLRTALSNILIELKEKYPLDLWMVTRVVDDDWIMLATTENKYGVVPDHVKIWKDTICTRMANHNGPNIAPKVSEVEMYVEAPIVSQIPIKCYVGYPLVDQSGKLMGTLCAIDPEEGGEYLHSQDEVLKRSVVTIECLLSQYNELSLLRGILKNYPELLEKQRTQESVYTEFVKLAGQYKLQLKEVGALLGVIIIEKNTEKTTTYNLKQDINLDLVKKNLRTQDLVFTLKDDNYVILMPDVDNKELTKTVVKMFNAFSNQTVHIKIGAHLSKQNESVEDALKNAKKRMIS